MHMIHIHVNGSKGVVLAGMISVSINTGQQLNTGFVYILIYTRRKDYERLRPGTKSQVEMLITSIITGYITSRSNTSCTHMSCHQIQYWTQMGKGAWGQGQPSPSRHLSPCFWGTKASGPPVAVHRLNNREGEVLV